MNKNTSKFAIQTDSPGISEACQRIAFTFGYRWLVADLNEICNTDAKYLAFNPETKEMLWTDHRNYLDTLVNTIANNFEDLVGLLNNPPKTSRMVRSAEVFANGDVKVDGITTVKSDFFDIVIRERNDFLGRNKAKMLPVVAFNYTSKSSGMKDRQIAITEWNDHALGGLDMLDDNKFKNFLFSNVNGPITFKGFTT